MVTVFHSLNQEQANTFSLVLNASGIGNRVTRSSDGFRIDVPEPYVDSARDVIGRYQAENPATEPDASVSRRHPTFNHFSGIAIALLLFSIHLAVWASSAPEDYLDVFGANARRIVDGEVYRCATALVLHADAAHVAGNMAGMILFGGAVCGVTGSGVGWLMILASGIFGNLMNAFAYETGHLSVGASTAVFGAVGILCAFQAVNAAKTGKGWKRTALVFGSGVALLVFLGTSARSDLAAHLFGFFSGALMGGAYRLWMGSPLGSKGQVLCGVLAALTLLLSWIRGVMN
ncbi:rhomboid family intramembrane serine protease [uncultured Desulfosarcina sp.]|uniref:rhomboid family intramembrane serine protease n=1 Tax=uncultured Desulfosarcina sp. TaxID=218289 RepID=UPI0029C8ED9B|nr:rhomboid family intramembrane serine protease [uncultured Desulfosarcina sp.]